MKTKKEIIDESVKYLEKNGRATRPSSTACAYTTQAGNKTIHCLVGRCIDPEKYEKDFEGHNVHSLDLYVRSVMEKEDGLDYILQDEYKGHELSFWSALQSFHDNSQNMLFDNSISPKGEETLKRLRNAWT